MDPFNITIAGSRYPITVLKLESVKPLAEQSFPQVTSPPSSSSQLETPSRIRRKPVQTYKSPSVNDGFRPASENTAQHLPPPFSSSSHTSSSASDKSGRPILNLRRQQPSLPLYHPLGRLAQSLPALDPAELGFPVPVDVGADDMLVDDVESRRVPARARRPAAKLRDRDQEEGDEHASVNGASAANGSTAERDARTVSPRKRRNAAGAGGAGGPKRRKKDVDDGTFPQPARRTRNPRGVAAASPLAGVAVAAVVEGAEDRDVRESPAPMEAPDLQTAVLQAQEARPVRSTRSRAPVKRRDSSASSSTSVSVSIAVHTQQTRIVEVPTEDTPVGDAEMADAVNTAAKDAESAMVREDVGQKLETKDIPATPAQPADPSVPATESKPDDVAANIPTSSTPSSTPSAIDRPTVIAITKDPAPKKRLTPSLEKPVEAEPVLEQPAERNESQPVREEKEEGELSDGPGQ